MRRGARIAVSVWQHRHRAKLGTFRTVDWLERAFWRRAGARSMTGRSVTYPVRESEREDYAPKV